MTRVKQRLWLLAAVRPPANLQTLIQGPWQTAFRPVPGIPRVARIRISTQLRSSRGPAQSILNKPRCARGHALDLAATSIGGVSACLQERDGFELEVPILLRPTTAACSGTITESCRQEVPKTVLMVRIYFAPANRHESRHRRIDECDGKDPPLRDTTKLRSGRAHSAR